MNNQVNGVHNQVSKKHDFFDDFFGCEVNHKGKVLCDVCDEEFVPDDPKAWTAHSHKEKILHNIPVTIKLVATNNISHILLKTHLYQRLEELYSDIIGKLMDRPELVPQNLVNILNFRQKQYNRNSEAIQIHEQKEWLKELDASYIRLVFKGHEMTDNKRLLRSYGITTDSIIYLVFKYPRINVNTAQHSNYQKPTPVYNTNSSSKSASQSSSHSYVA